MLNLDGILPIDKTREINNYTDLRFANKFELQTPEALALYEQRYLPASKIKEICEKHYGFELHEPVCSYVPEKIISRFVRTGCVPVQYRPMSNEVVVVYVPELWHTEMEYPEHKVEYRPTTIYYYLDKFQQCYGAHRCLKTVPAKILFKMITQEAIELGASDITISTDRGRGETTNKIGFNNSDCSEYSIGHNKTHIYYDVRKRKVHSNFLFSVDFMEDLLKILTITSPLDRGSRNPKAVDIDINKDYRGRVMINSKFGGGFTVTIRLVPNKAFDTSIYDLGFTPQMAKTLVSNLLDNEKGLRLMVGATSSGKNTTLLALLRELALTDKLKIVSVERPVEQELPGVEQINCNTPEEFTRAVQSLIRVNPDFVYITEIQDTIGRVVVDLTNTGKCVMSTIHANSVADTISRLVAITELSQDRIIQNLHSITYQELLRDEERDCLYPRARFVRFTRELKYKCFGKELGEVIQIIRDYEEGDVWTSTMKLTELS